MSKQDRKALQTKTPDKAAEKPAGRLSQYFWANLVFWAFLLVVVGVVWMTCQDPSDDETIKYVLSDTFKFIFLLFGLGFTLVTLFDAAYDFFASKAEDQEL